MENVSSTPTSLLAMSDDKYGEITANQVAEIRADIGQVKSDVRESIAQHAQHLQNRIGDFEGKITARVFETDKSIHEAECNITKNDNDIAHRSTIHLNSVERDLQNRVLENRQLLTKEFGDKTDRVLDRLDRNFVNLKDQIRDFEMRNAEKFCDVKTEIKDSERRILDQLHLNKLDEKNDEILKLRTNNSDLRYTSTAALQNQEIASLKNMINSIEQSQRFSSKTVQFGAGNVATPTQTANQG